MGQIVLPMDEMQIAANTASSVIKRAFRELIRVAGSPTSIDQEWFDTITGAMTFSSTVEIGFHNARALLLAYVKDRWDDLPFAIRESYNLQFYNFAHIMTGGAKRGTIDGWIRTASIWFIDRFGENTSVEIVDRAPDGKPILENGKIKTKVVIFDPYCVPMSKLYILNHRAKNKDMTPKLWEMLVDGFYTCEDVRIENTKEDTILPSTAPHYSSRYYLEGPALVVSHNGTQAVVGELNFEEYESNDIVKESIDLVLATLNVEVDEDAINRIIKESYTHARSIN